METKQKMTDGQTKKRTKMVELRVRDSTRRRKRVSFVGVQIGDASAAQSVLVGRGLVAGLLLAGVATLIGAVVGGILCLKRLRRRPAAASQRRAALEIDAVDSRCYPTPKEETDGGGGREVQRPPASLLHADDDDMAAAAAAVVRPKSDADGAARPAQRHRPIAVYQNHKVGVAFVVVVVDCILETLIGRPGQVRTRGVAADDAGLGRDAAAGTRRPASLSGSCPGLGRRSGAGRSVRRRPRLDAGVGRLELRRRPLPVRRRSFFLFSFRLARRY